MIRTLFFLIAVAAAAFAAVWLADRPGDVAITWMGTEVRTSVMVALAALAVLFVLAALIWSAVAALLRTPRRVRRSLRERRRNRGHAALSRGLVAVASGDTRLASRFAGEAERLAGSEPLTLLLRAQTAQLAGDRGAAEAAFRKMAERPDTHLLGLRGLYVEAQRRGDWDSARRHAEQAVRSAPALIWAGQAVFEFRCSSGDWAGALDALEANVRAGLIDKASYRRQRAVLLTARAMELQDNDRSAAKALANEAAKLAPDLVAAVTLAARLAVEDGEFRRAGKLVEAAWRRNPHPDLADVYTHLRYGDAARDRLARAQHLARLRPGERESALAVARAALDAHEFAAARAALEPLAAEPTQRVATLMAELEEAEHGDAGRAREWMGRALRAARDPCWTADGIVSEHWLPVSPVSGRVDAFEWKVPVEEIGHVGPVIASEPPRPVAALPARAPEPDNGFAPEPDLAQAVPDAAPAPAETRGETQPAHSPARGEPAPAAGPSTGPSAGPSAAPARAASRSGGPAVIPLIHAPDDPGPDRDGEAAERPAARVYPAAFR
jgi:HemY protein